MAENRVAFIISSLRCGGAENVCVTIANGMSARGYDITIVVLNLRHAVKQSQLLPEVRLVNLEASHTREAFFKFRKYLNDEKPPVILSFTRQLSVLIIIVRMFCFHKPVIISRNITYLSLAEKHKKGLWHGIIVKIIIKKLFPLSDYFIAQSYAMKDDLASYLSIDHQKIFVINNPLNKKVEVFHSRLRQGEPIEKKNYLLCVGRIDQFKAFHHAVNAFYQISGSFPELKLYIVGDGVLRCELEVLVRSLKIEQKVFFEGFINDVIPYYLHANTTLLTSVFEGFPNVLIESIALGTPVVAFDCHSGPREIIKNGINGFLVRYQDIEHLKDRLIKALKTNWDRDKIIKTSGKYRSTTIVDQYCNAIFNH